MPVRLASRVPSSRPSAAPGPSYTPTKEVGLVASDPLVLSAGGTTLDASHTTGAWIGETAWGLPYSDPDSLFQASGGGFSLFSLGPRIRMVSTVSVPCAVSPM